VRSAADIIRTVVPAPVLRSPWRKPGNRRPKSASMSCWLRLSSPGRGREENVNAIRVVVVEDAAGYWVVISSRVAKENSGALSWVWRFTIRTNRVPGSGAVSMVTAAARMSGC